MTARRSGILALAIVPVLVLGCWDPAAEERIRNLQAELEYTRYELEETVQESYDYRAELENQRWELDKLRYELDDKSAALQQIQYELESARYDLDDDAARSAQYEEMIVERMVQMEYSVQAIDDMLSNRMAEHGDLVYRLQDTMENSLREVLYRIDAVNEVLAYQDDEARATRKSMNRVLQEVKALSAALAEPDETEEGEAERGAEPAPPRGAKRKP